MPNVDGSFFKPPLRAREWKLGRRPLVCGINISVHDLVNTIWFLLKVKCSKVALLE